MPQPDVLLDSFATVKLDERRKSYFPPVCGQTFAFNEAISFIVPCDTQEEIDYLWGKLSADAKAEQCGWLKDKYGLSWQITPSVRRDLLRGNDKQRIDRVTQAFLKMKKLPRSSGRPRVDRLPKSFRIPDC